MPIFQSFNEPPISAYTLVTNRGRQVMSIIRRHFPVANRRCGRRSLPDIASDHFADSKANTHQRHRIRIPSMLRDQQHSLLLSLRLTHFVKDQRADFLSEARLRTIKNLPLPTVFDIGSCDFVI